MVYSILESVEVILVNWDLREEWWGVMRSRCVSCKKKKKRMAKGHHMVELYAFPLWGLYLYI